MKYIISGVLLGRIIDLPLLQQTRQVCGDKAMQDAIDHRIRELKRLGYGRCRPTPKLPQQIR